MENWKKIVGVPNYEVSDLGRVRSIARRATRGGVLKQGRGSSGGNIVVLYPGKERTGKTKSVHRLVAEHFLPNFFGKREVDHKNGDRTDDRVYNLRWCDRSQNNQNVKMSERNTSGVKGVNYDKNKKKWCARWFENKKPKMKRFDTKEEAVKFREEMVSIHYDPHFYIEDR